VDPIKGARQVEGMLILGEQVIACFKGVRDGVVFTSKRVIAFNVQGITGKKTAYTSLPYKRVQAFSIETAGVVDLDSELHLANRRERINIISKYMDYRLYTVTENREIPKYALNIAKMLGLNDEIIEGAKKYLK
jgi:hypothetical protein